MVPSDVDDDRGTYEVSILFFYIQENALLIPRWG